eukprot:TRINITY_DN20574_c0_g1_i1.p1 TRINITY_DN20574_c0_g1~~TRINITY_DN20574_c0_g1_i1.p1  ORF type:complete len:196 (+),score=18.31 TRINITY_DN20574_c0_g1_i1:89-676(+)
MMSVDIYPCIQPLPGEYSAVRSQIPPTPIYGPIAYLKFTYEDTLSTRSVNATFSGTIAQRGIAKNNLTHEVFIDAAKNEAYFNGSAVIVITKPRLPLKKNFLVITWIKFCKPDDPLADHQYQFLLRQNSGASELSIQFETSLTRTHINFIHVLVNAATMTADLTSSPGIPLMRDNITWYHLMVCLLYTSPSPRDS